MSFRPGGYFRLTADAGAIPALDGLRGIAILMVVLYHVTESFVSEQQPLLRLAGWDVATPLLNGWMGVQLFFVLSGFLITHHLLRRFRTDRGPELGRYLVKRWLRIAPTYYVILAIVALGLVPYYEVEPGRMGARVIYHALFLQDYLPSSLLGPFWSLGVEEKFYLAAPLIAFLLVSVRRPGAAMLALLLLGCIPLASRIAMTAGVIPAPEEGGFTRIWRNPFHLSMDALIVGCAVAWLSIRREAFGALATPRAAKGIFLTGVAGVAALLAIPSAAVHGTLFDRVALFPLVAVAFGCVLAGVVLAPCPARALESRWLARAGRVAYPWYLTHVLVMWAAWGSLNAAWPALSRLPGAVQFALFLPAYLATSAAAALLLHFAVEKPCLLLKDGIDRPHPAPRLDLRTESA